MLLSKTKAENSGKTPVLYFAFMKNSAELASTERAMFDTESPVIIVK